ncbi:MAG: hypothetical protein DRP64_13360, partial [Verrucomicrobia bacterium]
DRHDPAADLDVPPLFEVGMQLVEPRRTLERLSKGREAGSGELVHVFDALLAIFVSGWFFAHGALLKIGREHYGFGQPKSIGIAVKGGVKKRAPRGAGLGGSSEKCKG